MEKGDIVRVKITDMTDEGKGIGHVDRMAVFVDGALYGEEVDAKITKAKKRFCEAVLFELVKPSSFYEEENRICPYISDCGGCAYGRMNRKCENDLKERHVREKLSRIGGLENPNILPIVDPSVPAITDQAAPHPNYTGLNYRNKAVMAVGLSEAGKPLIGFRPRGSHDVVDCKDCRLQCPSAMMIAESLRSSLAKNKDGLSENGRLIIDEVTVRTSFSSGEVMVIFGLVNNGKIQEYLRDEESLAPFIDLIYDIDEKLKKDRMYSLESVYLKGMKTIHIAGKKTIEDEICGLRFEISPDSFYQVNPLVVESLYMKALEYAGGRNILDVYCGVGTIGLIAASRGSERVLGIESVKAAVLDANRNAVINGIVNAEFLCGKAEEILPEIVSGKMDESLALGKVNWDDFTVILDPPRKGCQSQVIEALLTSGPKEIVYVSCDPATLARDIKLLVEGGYEFIECTPFNMFLKTGHCECIVLMSRGKNY